MQTFDPDQIAVPSGHFIAGRLVPGAADAVMAVVPPSDSRQAGEANLRTKSVLIDFSEPL